MAFRFCFQRHWKGAPCTDLAIDRYSSSACSSKLAIRERPAKCSALRCCGSVTSLGYASSRPVRSMLDDLTGLPARIWARMFLEAIAKRPGPRPGRQVVRVDVNNHIRWPAISGLLPEAARSAGYSSGDLCVCLVHPNQALTGLRGARKLGIRNKRLLVAIYVMCLDAGLTGSVTGRSPRLLRNQMMSHARERPAETISRVGVGRLEGGHWGTTHGIGGCAC